MKDFIKFKEDFKEKRTEIEDYRMAKVKAAKRAQLFYIFPTVFFVVGLIIIQLTSIPQLGWIIAALSVASVWIIATEVVEGYAKHYLRDFKKDVLSKIVKELYPTAKYNAFRKVSIQHFKNSAFFESPDAGYSGEDYFDGKTENGYSFQFSELTAYRSNANNSSGARMMLFNGLFVVIDTPNLVYNNTTIFSKGRNNDSIYLIKGLLQKMFPNAEQVNLKKRLPELDKICDVYCENDPKGSFEILTPAMCEAITAIHNRWPSDFRMRFANGKIYLAIDSQVDMFRAKIDESLMNDAVFDRIYGQLRQCFDIAEGVALGASEIGTIEIKEEDDKDDDMPYDQLIVD